MTRLEAHAKYRSVFARDQFLDVDNSRFIVTVKRITPRLKSGFRTRSQNVNFHDIDPHVIAILTP